MALFDRTDFLLTRVALAGVAVLAPVFLVVVPLVIWAGDGRLRWAGLAGEPGTGLGDLVTPAHGARLSWDGAAHVTLPDAPTGLWLATLVPNLLLAAVVVTVALLLRRLVGETQRGRPFTTVSLHCLRVSAVVIIVASVLVPLVDGLVTSAVMAYVLADTVSFAFDFNPLWMLVGLLLLVLAEAFAAGSRLADDVEGLV